MSSRGAAYGLYVHIPFCRHICSYCDYPVAPTFEGAGRRMLEALGAEARLRVPAGFRARTVHIGGGTPTALPPDALADLLAWVREYAIGTLEEWTVEANPEDLSSTRLDALAEGGVTRVCVGVQSLDDAVLRTLGRTHDATGARESLGRARAACFRSVAADLLFGIRGQSEASFRRDLDYLADAGIDHVSVYGLTAATDGAAAAGRDAPERFDGLAVARRVLAQRGFEPYELTSFARPGHRWKHHVYGLRGEPLLGLGPGAAGFEVGQRRSNVRDWVDYEARVLAGRDPGEPVERPSPRQALAENAMARLHLAEGFTWSALADRGACDPRAVLGTAVRQLVDAGLLEGTPGGGARLSERGWADADRVFAEIVSAAM